MKWIKLAFLLSFVTLVLGCRPKEIVERTTSTWLEVRHKPIEEVSADEKAVIGIEVTSVGLKKTEAFLFYKIREATFDVKAMEHTDGHDYYATIPPQPRGTEVEYYIEVRSDGDLTARLPRKEGTLKFIYKGKPDRTLLIAHVALMFISLALLLLVGFLAIKAFSKRQIALHLPRLALLAMGIFFVTSFVLGTVIAYQTYGKAWSGFPVGTDVTDNKSLAIFLYFLVSTAIYRGSALRRDASTDLLPIRTIPYVYLVGVILTIVLFAIPH